MDWIFIIAGLVLLFFGGEGLLKGSVGLARRFGLSNFMIGAVVVGFGTSMPELSVAIKAALDGASGIVIGNVVGSNIANILLILGTCALICPIVVADRAVFRDVMVVIAASILVSLLAQMGQITFVMGLVLCVCLFAYLFYAYRQDRLKTEQEKAETIQHIQEDTEGANPLPLWQSSLYTLAGLALLAVGATMLVQGATAVARGFGIPESVIGLTLVAVGTSLPELATGVVAAWRRHTDIILGNILGSNLFNALCILGISALIAPVEVAPVIARYDVWVMTGVAVLLAIALKTGFRLSRKEGAVMLVIYMAYMGSLALQA